MGNRGNTKKNISCRTWNSAAHNSATFTAINIGSGNSVNIPKMSRECKCELCIADKKVEEFFTKKRYWWNNRWFDIALKGQNNNNASCPSLFYIGRLKLNLGCKQNIISYRHYWYKCLIAACKNIVVLIITNNTSF